MTRNPDLKGIIGIASTTCPGIAQAVEASGKSGSDRGDRLLLAQYGARLRQERRHDLFRPLEPVRSRLPDGLGRASN